MICPHCQQETGPEINGASVFCEDDLSVRDQFALAALNGLIAGIHWTPTCVINHSAAASDAYALADAMMKVRER